MRITGKFAEEVEEQGNEETQEGKIRGHDEGKKIQKVKVEEEQAMATDKVMKDSRRTKNRKKRIKMRRSDRRRRANKTYR
jgi:molybdopterin synthase catalytic subunit